MMRNTLQEAIQFEKDGVDLYETLAKDAKNKIAKMLFASLVKQEKDHITYINNYAKIEKFEPMQYIPLEKTVQDIFRTLLAEERKENISNIEGLEAALKLEDKGFRMYKDALEKAEGPEDKKFFKFLMTMEREHYEALANTHLYFTDNNAWVSENESKTWNWMNL
ncbi:MAG: ferritin family protein [Candidatus Margulisiibacteriota bacterium]|jgi:rubrerythrin